MKPIKGVDNSIKRIKGDKYIGEPIKFKPTKLILPPGVTREMAERVLK